MNATTGSKREKTSPGRWQDSAALFTSLSGALFMAYLAVRILELTYISRTANLPADLRNVLGRAFLSDSVAFLEMLPVLFLLSFLVHATVRSARARIRVSGAIGTLFVVLYAVLIKYFATARVPLGADLFGYSLSEIATTVRGGATIDAITLLLFLVPLALFWGSLLFFSSRGRARPVFAFVLLGTGIVSTFVMSALPPSTAFTTEFSHDLAMNKAAYFARESYSYLTRSTTGQVHATARAGRTDAGRPSTSAGRYGNTEYPFLRTDDTPDVLGRFFTIDPMRPPNLVFILVEGLGKAFSGPNAYLGSFTPFLDELAGKSLYWENFLASQGRTFAALPSILASLPFGEKGFSDLGKRMPRHLSLMSILKHNGYRIKFYYGSDPDFDNERLFLERQGVDVLIGIDDYDKSYVKSPDTSWGYPDREVMRKSIEMDRRDAKQPYVTFIQTMSMHSSYSVPDQERYLGLFEERMNALGFDEAQKERHRAYRKIYSTILYTDDALRFFFEEYAKLPAYGNTIFIITGDHRLPEIPMSTKVDRFHVPLIIFSPLLNRPAHFQSISSHLDIAPSLLAFLKHNYRIDSPSLVTWIGTGLDTDPSFRNIHSYPLKHTINNLIDYISGMYFLDQDVLFAVEKNMDLEPIQDDRKKQELIAEFDRYKERNDRFARDLKLIPDSLYQQYGPEAARLGQRRKASR
jgi:phosphoglycerol transferase MdoB-like AlkP superfamily enzyme